MRRPYPHKVVVSRAFLLASEQIIGSRQHFVWAQHLPRPIVWMNSGGVLNGSQLYGNTQRENGATEANQIVAIRDAKSVTPISVQTPSMPEISACFKEDSRKSPTLCVGPIFADGIRLNRRPRELKTVVGFSEVSGQTPETSPSAVFVTGHEQWMRERGVY